jgi:hypothetical protein
MLGSNNAISLFEMDVDTLKQQRKHLEKEERN